MKILVAEDDVTSRVMLEAILRKCGYEVIAVADGVAAWEQLQTPDAPRLMVLDWMMPKLSGPELCRRLREVEGQVSRYVILLTSRSERQDIVQGLESGADDYIAKPYDTRELQARVNVGRRILELQSELQSREKLQGVLEMAGAVCHELNQPLQAISGYSELLLMDIPENDPHYDTIQRIKEAVDRLGALARKIMTVTKYRSKEYLQGKSRIVDIDRAAERVEL